jgi:hypothetical protein
MCDAVLLGKLPNGLFGGEVEETDGAMVMEPG